MSRVRAGDAVVVALAALAVGASWAALWSGGEEPAWAEVSGPGGSATRLALAVNEIHRLQGRLGESVIEVRDGRARFADSACVGRQCVHTGWLSRSGQLAACLPNGVVLELKGGEREFDAITF